MDIFERHRFFLKDSVRKSIDFRTSDQHRGVPAPPIEKPFDPTAVRIQLPGSEQWPDRIVNCKLLSAISNRKSRRRFSSASISIEELSFLLWMTQGIRPTKSQNPSFRTVPSAGARHSFETYLFIMRVDGVKKGIYRYLPLENELLFLNRIENMEEELYNSCFGQRFVAEGALTFIWTTIPYRMEWRYLQAAHRVILIDVGHVCQNLYLGCEAISAGTCGVAAYDQELLDSLLGVDGENEFSIYLAPVGK